MKVYHYSHLEKWRDIQRGSWVSQDNPGLGANRRMGQDDPEAWGTGAAFALTEPLPDDWKENKDFKDIWKYLRADIGSLLLEIEVDPERDNVFVVDRGHIEGFLYKDIQAIPEAYSHESRKEAEKAYMESKIPLKDYLESSGEFRYSLPEVIFPQHVPIEKISISEGQPLLEEDLEKYKGLLKKNLIREIEAIPELRGWLRDHEGEDVHLEGSEIRLRGGMG